MLLSRTRSSEFRFNSGRLSLDLAATIRRRPSVPLDVLANAGACGRWMAAAGLFSDIPALSRDQEAAVVRLREAIWTLVTGAMSADYPEEATAVVNAAARYPIGTPQLQSASGTVLVSSEDPFATAMSIIARDAIELVSGPLRLRVRNCAQADCRMLFVDTSPAGQRRWCSMQRCGSRAKGHAFKQRHERADRPT